MRKICFVTVSKLSDAVALTFLRKIFGCVLPNRKNKINDRVALRDSCLWRKNISDFTASVGEKILVDLQPRARRQLPVQTCHFFCACEEVSWHFGSLLQWRKNCAGKFDENFSTFNWDLMKFKLGLKPRLKQKVLWKFQNFQSYFKFSKSLKFESKKFQLSIKNWQMKINWKENCASSDCAAKNNLFCFFTDNSSAASWPKKRIRETCSTNLTWITWWWVIWVAQFR